ncbi:phage tail protein [Collinsella sp. CM84Y_54]|uniref:phage tail protein n=1 Tax=Collinsella sp. CM84Y_54 TaxID=3085309 RepID=UPI002E78FF1A|nr:tape measure protein [Collinsella sp. CM84Y_54]
MADVASGSVLLTPKFDNLTSSIADQLDGAFSGASKIGGKAGSDAGGKFSSGLSAKAGAVMGLVSSVTSKAFNAISNSLGSAIGRVDTMNNFPKVMKNLGYSSDDATASIKKMSASIDGLPTSLPALTGMVQQLAPLCGGLDEATNIGIAFNDMCLASGASTADVSRAMQQYSQILSKGKPELQDWKTLQEVMPGQLNQVAKALIGPTANSKDLYNALKDGSITMDDFNAAVLKLDQEGVDGFASFAQQAKDSTQGIGTALDNISNRVAKAVQTIINAFGAENISGAINAFSGSFGKTADAIATVIYGIKDVVSKGVSGIASVFAQIKSALPSGFLDGIVNAFNQLAPAIMPAITAFTLLLPVMGGMQKVFGIVSGFKSLGAALSAVAGGPVGLIIAAIAAVVVGLAALYNTNEDVRNAINSAWSGIQSAAAQVWPYIQQAVTTACSVIQGAVTQYWPVIQQVVTQVMSAVKDFVVAAWPTIQAAFTTACSVIQSIIQAVWPVIQAVVSVVMSAIQLIVTQVWPTVQNYISMACQVIMAVINAVWPVIQTIITTVMTVIMAVISVVWPIIQTVFSTACAVIAAVINAVWPVIQTVITTVMQVINAVIGTVLAAIQGNWSGVWEGIKAIASTVWNGIKNIVSSVINAISGIISSVLGTIKGAWDSCWNGIKSAFSSIWNGIKSAATSGVNAVYNTVKSIKDKIVGFFAGAGSWLVESGRAILNGLKDGIMSAIGSVTSAVSNAVAQVRAYFPFSPAKTGPFSGHGYTTYSGRALMTSFGEGIGGAASGVVSSTKSALSDVQELFGAKSLAFAADASVTGNIAARRATPGGGYSMLSIGNLSVDAGGIRDEEVVNAINTIVGYARRTAGAM